MGVIDQGLKGYGHIDYWIILGYMVVWLYGVLAMN